MEEKKKKKQKDPDPSSSSDSDNEKYAPPKRGLTNYFFFLAENREKFKKENPDLEAKNITKMLGSKWNKLSDSEKSPYDALAEKDRERYNRQMNEYEAYGKFYDDNGKQVKILKKRKRSMSAKKKDKKKAGTKKR